jgi:23S rRNA (pseudouridine1915-N3)-methyltransferase
MKIKLLLIGKTDLDYLKKGLDEYAQRLKHYLPFEMIIIPDIKNTKNLSEVQQKQKEGELILNQLNPGDYIILLDEKGKEYSSVDFSEFLMKHMVFLMKYIKYVIQKSLCRK